MKSTALVLQICGVLILCAAIYVFAPTLKSRLEERWIVRPLPVPASTHNEKPAPSTPAAAPKPRPVMPREDKGAVGPPDPGSPRAASIEGPNLTPRPPKSHTKSVSLMPQQAFNIQNQKFQKVEVRSEYPIRVYTGPCHSDYTVEFFCETGPADLFITDTRRVPIFLTPKANTVTITLTEF